MKYSESKAQTFGSQLKRIKFITGKGTQAELADFLGLRQSSISDAKRRGKIPPSWLVALIRIKGIHPEWVITGNGPCFIAMPPASGCYETGEAAVGKKADEDALRRLSSRALADELLRRIAVSQGCMCCSKSSKPG